MSDRCSKQQQVYIYSQQQVGYLVRGQNSTCCMHVLLCACGDFVAVSPCNFLRALAASTATAVTTWAVCDLLSADLRPLIVCRHWVPAQQWQSPPGQCVTCSVLVL
jgi:hypothetical protein